MLSRIGKQLAGLPRKLEFVRELEAFEGPILSLWKSTDGPGLYLQKWCARERPITRYLVVRTEQKPLALYLAGRLSMLTLLNAASDGVAFIVDRKGGEDVAVYREEISDLPANYLPQATAFHDEDLRPDWETIPQSFLVEDWDARLYADIEHRYLNVASFSYLTEPGKNRKLPARITSYRYDRGFPVVAAFNRIRNVIPEEMRSKSVGISANSPGVLTLETPASTAKQVAKALAALPGSMDAYRALQSWARFKTDMADKIPDPVVARQDLLRLCHLLSVDEKVLLPPGNETNKVAILVAGKLIAAYHRRLRKLLHPREGVEFISAKIDGAETASHPQDGDEDEDEDEGEGYDE